MECLQTIDTSIDVYRTVCGSSLSIVFVLSQQMPTDDASCEFCSNVHFGMDGRFILLALVSMKCQV